jgi:hypothetical protein
MRAKQTAAVPDSRTHSLDERALADAQIHVGKHLRQARRRGTFNFRISRRSVNPAVVSRQTARAMRSAASQTHNAASFRLHYAASHSRIRVGSNLPGGLPGGGDGHGAIPESAVGLNGTDRGSHYHDARRLALAAIEGRQAAPPGFLQRARSCPWSSSLKFSS